MFRTLECESELLLGKTPQSIKKYELENLQDFKRIGKKIKSIQKTELLNSIRTADVCLIADFHTFEQAQRTALRIAREAVEEDQTWYLGLELVPSQFQIELDQYQAGKISTESFHKTISYAKEWGFPWKNYAPLFEWARKNQVRLIALNRPKPLDPRASDSDDLYHRDLWAAGIITDLFHLNLQKKIKSKMILLYGELHIGTLHLPKQIKRVSKEFLKRPLSTVIIHQNENNLYWKLAQQERELKTTIVRLKKNTFCVLSSTPWAKLQSLVNWAEGIDSDPLHSGAIDDLSLIYSYGNTIAKFFNSSPCSYESLNTHRIDQIGFLDSLEKNPDLTREEKRLISQLVSENQRFYLQKLNLAFLGSSSTNGIAEISGIYLLWNHLGSPLLNLHFFRKNTEDFFKNLIESSFGYFTSLIINPKRKCDLANDHLQRIADLERGESQRFKNELEARKITTQFLNSCYEKKERDRVMRQHLTLLKDPQWKTHSLFIASRFIGQIVGKKMHGALLSEKISVDWIKKVFLMEPQDSQNSNTKPFQTIFELLKQKIEWTEIKGSKHDEL
jgi:hypothetical protein